MKRKRPNRLQFWTVILLGYVVIFFIGFFIPVGANAVNEALHPDKQTTAKSSSSPAKSTHKMTKAAKKAKVSSVKKHHSATAQVASTMVDGDVTAADTLNDVADSTIDQTTTNAAMADTTEATEDVTSSADTSDAAASTTVPDTVVVDRGTTAYSLAKANGLTLAQLQALNPTVNLDGMQAGQVLNINQ